MPNFIENSNEYGDENKMIYKKITLDEFDENVFLEAYIADKIGDFVRNAILVIPGGGYRKVGRLKGDKTGIIMEIYTDRGGLQFYPGNMIEEGRVCKDGAIYGTHHGICLETQAFPNNIKFSHFPGSILKKGEKYETITTYKFI